jgi:hypothetical protein
MLFQLNHLIHVFLKFQTFQKIRNIWQLFSPNCWFEVHDSAAAYTVVAVSIRAPAGDRWEMREQPGCRKWPYWRTIAAAYSATSVAELGPTGMRPPFFDLQLKLRAAPQWWPACIQSATYVEHFFQANFELSPYDVKKWAASRLKIDRRHLDFPLNLWHRL